MPTTYNFYDLVSQNYPANTTGTWSYVGVGSTGLPPLPPDPPSNYDDDVTFEDGVAEGTYVYQYSADGSQPECTHNTLLTFVKEEQVVPINDDCAGAKGIFFPYGGGVNSRTQETNVESCPGIAAPADSGIAIPAPWGSGTFVGDLWYRVTYNPNNNPPGQQPIAMNISVDGTAYGASGIIQPLIAVYEDCAGTLVQAEPSPPPNNQVVNTVIDSVFASSFTYYIRVACLEGNQGMFDVEITV
jgi:hypothetical protein